MTEKKSPFNGLIGPILNPILILCGAVVVINVMAAYLQTYWPWIVGIGGTALTLWIVVAVGRWLWSRRK